MAGEANDILLRKGNVFNFKAKVRGGQQNLLTI